MPNGFDVILLLQPGQEQVPHAQDGAFCFSMGTSAQNQGWHCEGRHGHKSPRVPSRAVHPRPEPLTSLSWDARETGLAELGLW